MAKKLHPKIIFNSEVEFILGAHNVSQIPVHRLPEVAFLGASNVGKSSLINALMNRKIAIVSNTPGRTRQLNFFKIFQGTKDYFMLVDMPGYGFAKAQEKHKIHWMETASQYLINRKNLRRLFLLIDPIKGLKEADLEAIDFLNKTATNFQIVLTKTDKLSRDELAKARAEIEIKMQKWAAVFPQILEVSASKGYGIFDLQDAIVKILES